MSKKHRRFNQFNQTASSTSSASQDLATEYRTIKHDLIRLVILNAIVLAAVLAVYYTNQQSHYLDNLTAKFLHL